jgi:hypothetical protein
LAASAARRASSATRRASSVAATSVRSWAASWSVRSLSVMAWPSAVRWVRAISTVAMNSMATITARARWPLWLPSLAMRTIVGVSTRLMNDRKTQACVASNCTELTQMPYTTRISAILS